MTSASAARIASPLLGTLGALGALALAGQAHAATACDDLAKTKVPGAEITAVKALEVGALQEIDVFGIPPLPTGTAYCRVNATLKPTPASSILVEVWLPTKEAWNGKFMATGNGGYGGALGGPRLAMRPAIKAGYAVAGTDMGHTENGAGGEANWALNQPEKIADWGHRANHETAAFAKAMIAAYYGQAPRRSYFTGCSDGGREALMEAQRYPGDFDGIVAGAPANAWTRLMASFAWSWKAVHERPESRLSDANLAVVQKAVLAQCDKLDGVADGIIEDPRRCRFDPAVVQCKDGQSKDCLTPIQVDGLRKLYQGPRDAKGKPIYPGYPAGGEAVPNAWPLWISGEKAQHPSFARSFFANFVYSDTGWQLARMNLDRDLKAAQRLAPVVASDNPDLSAFKARGGKLIMYHGWADAAITPLGSIQYYDAVRARMGVKSADEFSRLFMVPGMSHCFGGPGADSFDMLATIDGWVEGGRAPDVVIATKNDNDYAGLLGLPSKALRTRPLCAYPKVAQWDGKGSTDEAASYSCVASK
ncbi:MAG: tannase/feruloyl esterase family alpha/beta hydrolase [Caulobacter sp.]|nr:tannase/feruloyl esterase family alpha/beta hydrolase [Caulobacter sp.]